MIQKSFRLETEDGAIVLESHIERGEGELAPVIAVKWPAITHTLSVFEAKKLAKGLLDTIDFGSMI